MFKLSDFISKPLFVSFVFLLLCAIIITVLFLPTIEANRKAQYYKIYEHASNKITKISYELYSRINLNQILSTFIENEEHNLTQDKFERFVHTIIENDGGIITSMAFGKDFIITHISPYKLNKKALGLNLMADTVRAKHFEDFIESNKPFVEGPYILAQGYKGIVSYTPVYEDMILHGVADVVIAWDKFLEITELDKEDDIIDIAIRGKNGEGEKGAVFYGDSTIFHRKDVIKIPIALPLGKWIFAAYPKDGWTTGIVPYSIIVSYSMALLFSILIFFILKYSHKQIQMSEQRYRYITEKSIDIIWTIDWETLTFTYISDSCLRHTGYTPEEYYQMELKDIIDPKFYMKLIKRIDSAIDTLEASNSQSTELIFELQQITKKGKLIWVEISAVLSVINGDELAEIIGISRIVNDRKKIELEMLTQQEELKKLNSMKNRFFSIVAHDLKNPISSLLSISQFLIDDYNAKKDDAVKEDIEMLHLSTVNTYKLLENLLEWSRSQMDATVHTPAEIPITRILNDCVEHLTAQAAAKNIPIKLNNSLGECVVNCDYNMIQTVLRNLVSNALKFSFVGATVEIGAANYKEDINYIQVSVKDSGVGIDTKNMNKLFRIDEKIVSSKGTSDESGTGLGLILCKEFIDKHKCKIWVESEKGKGTTFFFTLPKVK